MRVLVVDDEQDARELLHTLLSQEGAEVVAASSAAEADRVIGTTRPDVLICDIRMPDEDGYQFLRRLRASGLDPRTLPAVALSAYRGANDRRDALEAGFQEHVAKPMDNEHLVELVVQMVRKDARGRSGPV